MGRLLGNPVFNWVGTRSYGMYLYHWPIYQIIRGQAGVMMTGRQWVLAMCLTLPITEASYRYIETPIRQGRLGEWMRGERRPRTAAAYKRRQRLAGFGVASAALVGFAGVSIAMADNRCVGQIECDSQAGRGRSPPHPLWPPMPRRSPPTGGGLDRPGGHRGSGSDRAANSSADVDDHHPAGAARRARTSRSGSR